jgi:cleavage and polyadenylation specificity factor subunit 1
LAILYESEQTFAGRLAFKKDSVSLIVVSFDIFQKTYPVLFSVDGLPYNCTHILPAPTPLGGIVIFSHNALIHLDQTHTPGCAAIVNPFFDLESHFKPIPTDDGTPMLPVKNQPTSIYERYGKTSNCKSLGITLDGSRATFISPDILLLVLRTGDMYQVDLIGDEGAGRSWKRKRGGVDEIMIKSLGLNMALPSILYTLINMSQFTKPQKLGTIFQMDGMQYYSNYLFAASAAANASLIQFVEPIEETTQKTETYESMEVDLDDELDIELYGGSTTRKIIIAPQLSETQVKFRICDTLLSTGPMRHIALGQPSPYSEQSYSGEPIGSHLEIVACGGFDTYGSLVVLHKSVRPVIMSSFSLGRVNDIWSVPTPESKNKDREFNRYLLLSRTNKTDILRTGEEIEELETSEFYTSGPTVCIGVCISGTVIVQVYSNGILCLTEDGRKISDMSFGDDQICAISGIVNDPYCALLLNDGTALLVQIAQNSKTPVILTTLMVK